MHSSPNQRSDLALSPCCTTVELTSEHQHMHGCRTVTIPPTTPPQWHPPPTTHHPHHPGVECSDTHKQHVKNKCESGEGDFWKTVQNGHLWFFQYKVRLFIVQGSMQRWLSFHPTWIKIPKMFLVVRWSIVSGNILRNQPKDTEWASPVVGRCQNNKYLWLEISEISKTKL